MPLRKSFIVQLFIILLALLLVSLAAAGVGIYFFARQVAGAEFVRLNQASLRQVASATGRSLSELRALGERISVNSRLIELSALPGDEGQKEARSMINDLVTEYNATHTNNRSLMDVFVIGNNGLYASIYNSGRLTLDELSADPVCAPVFQGKTNMVMLPTVYNSEGHGVLVYTFRMIFAMKDLLTGEQRGVVVLDLSELTLYNQYNAFQRGGAELMVISPGGIVLSSQNKKAIGTLYGYDLGKGDQTAVQSSVGSFIKAGNFQIYERIPGTDWLLAEQIPVDIAFASLTQVRNVTFGVITLCSVLALLALAFIARRILDRVLSIQKKMELVTGGDLTAHIHVVREDEFGRIETAFNSMVSRITQLIAEVRQGERQKRLAELDFLQAQINPHFIQNTLTSIRFMLEMDKAAEAGEMVFYFSKLLRQTLSRSDEFITLREELNTLENYVRLQELRYKDSFEVSYDISPETMEARVPALILQPVVENSIFHGLGHAPIHIRILSRREQNRLILLVEDDGVGMSKELQETVLQKDVQINRVGLRNVHDRIQLNYGKEYGLIVSGLAGIGTMITFIMPYQMGDETMMEDHK